MQKTNEENPTPRGRRAALPLLVLALLFSAPSRGTAQEAAAVLSKGSGLYFETFLAFQKSLGRPIASFDLSKEKPKLGDELKAAVAFGSMAAAFEYPGKAKVIYLLAPGYEPKNTAGRFAGISALPDPAQAVAAYKLFQPGLRRLAVFFKKGSADAYLSQLSGAGKALGMEIFPVGLGGPLEFPGKLRGLQGKLDAFWLLPEPALINKTSLQVLAEFSCSNKIPFYAPSGGLTELGAAASFAPTYEEAGKAAAAALEAALAGKPLPGTIYVARSELTVNRTFSAKCGLQPAEGGAK